MPRPQPSPEAPHPAPQGPRPSLRLVQGGGAGPLRDSSQRPLPLVPQKGFKLEVRDCPEYTSIFTSWTVHAANGRSFVVYSEGQRLRLPNAAWRQWLAERLLEGAVTVVDWGQAGAPPPGPRLVVTTP